MLKFLLILDLGIVLIYLRISTTETVLLFLHGFCFCWLADYDDVPAYQLSLVEDTNAIHQLVLFSYILALVINLIDEYRLV